MYKNVNHCVTNFLAFIIERLLISLQITALSGGLHKPARMLRIYLGGKQT